LYQDILCFGSLKYLFYAITNLQNQASRNVNRIFYLSVMISPNICTTTTTTHKYYNRIC